MTPQKKVPQANQKTEQEVREDSDSDVQNITIGNKNLNVKLSLSGRGVVLVYAIAFAIVFGVIAWFAVQLIVALKMCGKAFIPSVTGFILWASIAFISALLSR